MFSKQEWQVITQTLKQKRDWFNKSLGSQDQLTNKPAYEKNIQVIDGILEKINALQNPVELTPNTNNTENIAHYISTPATSPIRQAALSRRQNLQPKEIRVLLVDDDELICELVCTYLQAVGIKQIDRVHSGLKAISAMYDAYPTYNLVLCDWNMPTKSGLDVHNAMRAAERYMAAVFMLVTSVSDAKQIRNAIEEGVDDYIVKPIEPEVLIKKIARFFPSISATPTA
ncbi:response regulator [Cellvibrio japonicus]|uniref:Chemotaxis protein CheY n=1 Tax=Cellvibrio japonicus (strain Ueda107) TaxID=498211 RepID=B3PGQ0_CELJU|nr:response regulator [Cellvibrio japonicus]ACE84256.1 chemotaxis protein CheY [Cellvibrio japonicus Ueda107]QEI12395.1 response regulator [Cellvibrio japonicus]QEI15968.1 response regulator [Cellvibrio japonicus]QEI19547.1 response regulator [Cellvibrio japonicus]